MNNLKINIWGRDFSLNVVYLNFPDEEITHLQKMTYEKIQLVDFETSLIPVKKYILKNDGDKIPDNNIDNVFKYMMPKSIAISRHRNNRLFSIMCNYKFDLEHGLAIVYENENFKMVGLQDIVL